MNSQHFVPCLQTTISRHWTHIQLTWWPHDHTHI